jgi:Ca-activated chloride channel family protein
MSDSETSSLSGAAGEAVVQATRALNKARIPVYLWAIASDGGGAVVDAQENPLQQNLQTMSSPDLASYRALIAPGGGRVVQVSNDDRDLRTLYTQGILNMPASKGQADKTRSWRELFAYPLALALLLLLLNHLRLSKRSVIAVAALAGSAGAQADDALWREAYAAYSHKQYLLAQQHYRGLIGYQARMGEGAAAYFTRAICVPPQMHLRACCAIEPMTHAPQKIWH